MGTFTIEKWKCDRCGEVHDERPRWPGAATYELTFREDYQVGAGRRLEWKEVCENCHDFMSKLMDDLSGKKY